LVGLIFKACSLYPSVWNGEAALNGGNREWAEEDAALHAYNMVDRFLLFQRNLL
jgi:hypothetical protein